MDFQQIVGKIKKTWKDIENIDKILMAILVVFLFVRLLTLFYLPYRGWDETVYLNLGFDLSKNPFFYSLLNSGWNDYIPSSDTIYGWPNIGFRAPLLPYLLSLLYFLKLDFFIPAVIPLIATLSIFLVYKLGGMLFNKRVGLYSATLFSLIPIHIYASGKIWTDVFVVFFILLTFVSFWKGYENENNRHKVLFGLFLALSLMSRYTTLWIAPIFLLYFIFRDKSLKFINDKYLWRAVLTFFLILLPWFIYSIIFYSNPFGAFIHGFKAAGYWGGAQSGFYFFINSWRIFSIIGLFFIVSLLMILIKKEYLKKEVYLLLIWIVFFSIMVISMPHKEDRFIMPIIPAVCLISGFYIDKLKKFKYLILGILLIFLILSLFNQFKIEKQNAKDLTVSCFVDGNKYLASSQINKNSLIITNQDPIVHYYTKKDIMIYPNPLELDSLNKAINSKYSKRDIYLFFANYDMVMDSKIKKDLDDNFKKVYECSKGYGYSAIYKYDYFNIKLD